VTCCRICGFGCAVDWRRSTTVDWPTSTLTFGVVNSGGVSRNSGSPTMMGSVSGAVTPFGSSSESPSDTVKLTPAGPR
jgi:hypothetical protein